MKEFKTELLREKFVIHDPAAADGQTQIIALSNRIIVDLKDEKGKTLETLVVRAQNMHSAVRMGARIIQSFVGSGPLLDRPAPFDWNSAWNIASGEYEQDFNPQRWVAVYNQGRPVFENGDHHPMLDVIEKCAFEHKGNYDSSIKLAEKIIKESGKVIRIDYDGNYALVVDLQQEQGRCGIILRSPQKTTTFNFSVAKKGKNDINFAQCVGGAAAFLEGIQLAFMVGMNGEKIKRGIIARHSDEEKQTYEGRTRLARLTAEIVNLEGSCEVRYRPEKPEFHRILNDAERLAQKMLTPAKKY